MKKTRTILLALFVAVGLSACTDAVEKRATGKIEKAPEKSVGVTMNRDNEQKKHVRYFIAPKWADCMGVAPQKCLQVKKQKEEDWSLFYSTIEGFMFEEGYAYELVVETEKIATPPMDSSSIRYKLVEIVSKELSE